MADRLVFLTQRADFKQENEGTTPPDKYVKVIAADRFEIQERAEELCKSQGSELFAGKDAQLLTITSATEQEITRKFLFEQNGIVDHVWLGLKDVNGNYLWNDDEPATYFNWAEDDKADANKSCVQIESGFGTTPPGSWVRVDCRKRNVVVCEAFQPVNETKDDECDAVDCEMVENLRNTFMEQLDKLEKQIEDMENQVAALKSDPTSEAQQKFTELEQRISALENEVSISSRTLSWTPPSDWQKGCGMPEVSPAAKKRRKKEKGKKKKGRLSSESNTNYGEFPWQIAVFVEANKRVCSATMISQNWALSDAKCFDDHNPEEYTLKFGEYDILNDNEKLPVVERKIEKLFRHFRQVKDKYDYGLVLLLFRAVEYSLNIHHICLPTDKDKYFGVMGTIAGWGDSENKEIYKTLSTLLKMDVKITDWNSCQFLITQSNIGGFTPDLITENHVCSLVEKGKNPVCPKDSGGSLIVKGKDGKWTVVGIMVNAAAGCDVEGFPAIFHNIKEYLLWILDTIKGFDLMDYGPP